MSRMASIDSSLAGAMKLHVFTTSTSAVSGSSTSSWPRRVSTPSMTSLSTWFFGQPRVRRCTRRGAGVDASAISVPEVRELQRDAEVVPAQQLDHGLQIILLLTRHPHLIALDGDLHLELGVLDQLHDLTRLVGGDALLQVDLLLGAARRAGLDRPGLYGLQRDLTALQLLAHDVAHRPHFVVVRGQQVDDVVLAPHLRLDVAEVEALRDLAQGLVDGVVDLAQVDPAHHVEEGHSAGVNRQAAVPRQPRPEA